MINYQGRLVRNNLPVNKPVDMVFELYPSDTATTPIWDETHNNVPVHNGLFRRVLDLSSIGQDTWTAGQELWLEVKITVDGEQETLSPREPIYAYPFPTPFRFRDGVGCRVCQVCQCGYLAFLFVGKLYPQNGGSAL